MLGEVSAESEGPECAPIQIATIQLLTWTQGHQPCQCEAGIGAGPGLFRDKEVADARLRSSRFTLLDTEPE